MQNELLFQHLYAVITLMAILIDALRHQSIGQRWKFLLHLMEQVHNTYICALAALLGFRSSCRLLLQLFIAAASADVAVVVSLKLLLLLSLPFLLLILVGVKKCLELKVLLQCLGYGVVVVVIIIIVVACIKIAI